MGLPVDDFERGDGCADCFDPNETPKEVVVVLSGTEINDAYVLHQIFPCTWEFGGPIPALHIRVRFTLAESKLEAEDGAKQHFFDSHIGCGTEFHDVGRDAQGLVFWGVHPGVAAMVGSGYLWSGPGTKYEPWYWGDNQWTFRLCNKKLPANILVRYEP